MFLIKLKEGISFSTKSKIAIRFLVSVAVACYFRFVRDLPIEEQPGAGSASDWRNMLEEDPVLTTLGRTFLASVRVINSLLRWNPDRKPVTGIDGPPRTRSTTSAKQN